MPGGRGGCGARGRSLISFALGRSGHHACRHYDRHARCVAGSGKAVGGVTPAPWTAFPRSLARIAPRDHTPLGRAVVERRQASAPESGRGGASRLLRGATRAPFACGRCYLRLPAFRFPYFFIRSPDERSDIRDGHGGFSIVPGFRSAHPGYGEELRAVRHRCLTSLARKSRRGNGITHSPPLPRLTDRACGPSAPCPGRRQFRSWCR